MTFLKYKPYHGIPQLKIIQFHFIFTFLIYFFNFLFYTGILLINNVVLFSGVQQSDSAIHILGSTLFQVLFLFTLLHNTEQSSLCYTVGPCWFSILNIAVCTYIYS